PTPDQRHAVLADRHRRVGGPDLLRDRARGQPGHTGPAVRRADRDGRVPARDLARGATVRRAYSQHRALVGVRPCWPLPRDATARPARRRPAAVLPPLPLTTS